MRDPAQATRELNCGIILASKANALYITAARTVLDHGAVGVGLYGLLREARESAFAAALYTEIAMRAIAKTPYEPNPLDDPFGLVDASAIGDLYLIGHKTDGPVKIGRSENVRERLAQIQTHSPVEIEVIDILPGCAGYERYAHASLHAHRHHGEWFNRHPDVFDCLKRIKESIAA